MKKIVLIIIFLTQFGFSQEITLVECLKSAKDNSPLQIKMKNNEVKRYLEDKNLKVNYLPSVNLNARATYQSDVFSLPIELPPNLGSIPEISKDQYTVQLDVNQVIYDGGATSAYRNFKNSESLLNTRSLKIDLYKINNIINELFFGILKIDAYTKNLEIIKNDLNEKRKIIESSVKNGVLLQSDLNSMDIEIKKIEQNIIELNNNKITFIEMLEKWTEKDLKDKTFKLPDSPELETDSERPELKLLSERSSLNTKSKDLIKSNYMPKIGAFIQAGYGRPTPVNFFTEDFESYYKAGIQLQWNLWSWNKFSRELQITNINEKSIEADRENFIKANNIEMTQYLNNINKYDQLINSDQQILNLQKEVIQTKFSKLQNGTVTSTEYITEQNNLNRYMINLDIHKIELLQSKYNLLYAKGGINNINGDK